MEMRARQAEPSGVLVSGAGTHGFDGHPVDPTMAQVMADRGFTPGPVEAFRSRPLTRGLIAEADLVLTAEASHRVFVLDEVPTAFRKVFSLGQFAETVAGLDPELGGAALVSAAARRRAPTRTVSDIADPYRRGAAAAEACADTVDQYLVALLPRLTVPRTSD